MEPVKASFVPAKTINIVFNSTNINLTHKCMHHMHQYGDYKDIHLLKINTFTQGDLLSCLEFNKGWLYSARDSKGFLQMIETANSVSIVINKRLAHLKSCTEVINKKAFEKLEKDDFQKLQNKEGNVRKQSEQSIKNYLQSLEINKNTEDDCRDFLLEVYHGAQNNTFFIGCFEETLRKDVIKKMGGSVVEIEQSLPAVVMQGDHCNWVNYDA